MKRTLTIAILAASAAALAPSAFAQVTYSATVNTAPPPPRHETVPKLEGAHFWSPGYWKWDGHNYQWVAGHLETARPGYSWTQPQWVRYNGGWRMREGGWHPMVAMHNPPPAHDNRDDHRNDNRNDHRNDRPATPPDQHNVGGNGGGTQTGGNGGTTHRGTRSDRDHDGVPDRRDAAPDDPSRH